MKRGNYGTANVAYMPELSALPYFLDKITEISKT